MDRRSPTSAQTAARSGRLRLFLALTAALALPASAMAQSTSATNVEPRAAVAELPRIEAEREILFRRMMADPANLDIAFQYAALSSRAGDLEAAIATLERMLIFAPGLPRLQLELGVLYYRLGAYESASSYFTAALAAPNVPPEVRTRVEPYLASIEERTAIDSFGGAVIVGGRYQTNANAAPESRSVNLNGVDFLLNDASISDSDVNGFVSASFRYSRDLASQGDRLEANLLTYGALYAERDELNTGLAELTVGPSFNLERFRIDEAALGVYAILGGVLLDGDPYLLSGGVGTSLAKGLGPRSRALARLEYRRESFRDSDLRPTASNRTGDRVRASATLEHRLTPSLTVFGIVEGERREADFDFLSLWEAGASVGGTLSFPSPLASQTDPWSLTLSGGYVNRSYDEPDPIFSRSEAEEDDEFFVQGALSIPIRDEWSVQAVGGYRDASSNYDIRQFDNFSASIGLMRRF